MSSLHNEMNADIQLPAVLAIGFTGHRSLPDEAMCRKLIYDFLAEKKGSTTEILYGVSSVASGGDLLFAESCITLNIPLRVLLPLPQEDFRKDFDASTWSRAEQAMRSAISIEVVGNDDLREERYYECGLETVQQSQLLVALWNGQPAQGLGGTGEIAAFAGRIGRGVIWIHSVTGVIQISNPQSSQQIKSAAELKFLNQLPSAGISLAERSPAAIALAWHAKLDANAIRVAPQVRRLAAMPIVLTALAAFVSGALSRRHAGGIWMAAGALLGLAASLLPAALRLGKRQALWVRIRTAAEVTRSVLALWAIPARYQVVGPEILPELNGMLLALSILKSQAAQTSVTAVDQFREEYLKTRLLGQKEYFYRQSMQSARKAQKYRRISKACIAGAVVLSAWTYAGRSLIKIPHVSFGAAWLPLLISALFQLATIAGALLVVYDCDRRQRRYQEIYQALELWEKELRALHTWRPVTQVVERVERALLVELLEWRSLLQNMKMPKN